MVKSPGNPFRPVTSLRCKADILAGRRIDPLASGVPTPIADDGEAGKSRQRRAAAKLPLEWNARVTRNASIAWQKLQAHALRWRKKNGFDLHRRRSKPCVSTCSYATSKRRLAVLT